MFWKVGMLLIQITAIIVLQFKNLSNLVVLKLYESGYSHLDLSFFIDPQALQFILHQCPVPTMCWTAPFQSV